MASTNEKISSNIADDLALNILSKLPVKSLKRFGSVRKSWSTLLENPLFMSAYFENLISTNDDSALLLQQQTPRTRQENLLLISGERYENKLKLDWPPPFQDNNEGISVYGSCIDGIICVHQGTDINIKVVLWNPTTEEFKVIPSGLINVPGLDFTVKIHGFGYDHLMHDYKLIQLVNCFEDEFEPMVECPDIPEPFWQIYSLKSNCWRKLDLKMTGMAIQPVGSTVYLNGVCHWWGFIEHNQEMEVEDILVSFDMSNEMFHTTSIDKHSCDEFVDRVLVVFNGSVAAISKVAMNNCFDILILGEVGVKESWVKLFTVGPLPCVQHPIGIAKKGHIFFRKDDNELAWFDLNTQILEEIGIKGEAYCCQSMIYKKSLLPIGGIN